MNKDHCGRFEICTKFSEIIVLSLSFLLFALFSNDGEFNQIVMGVAIYSTINLIFIRLSKAYLSKINNNPIVVLNLLTENFIGLITGGIVAFHLINLLLNLDNVMMVLIFSSIMTFFILGTFSPLMETTSKNVARR